jgi:HK97 gp10 family phage protein
MARVVWSGVSELKASLGALNKEMQVKAARSATAQAAGIVRRQAVSNVRAEGLVLTGAFAKNVSIKREAARPGLTQYNVGVRHGRHIKGDKTVVIKAIRRGKLVKKYVNDPFYWRFLEFGTKRGIRARHVIGRAFDSRRGDALEKMRTVLALKIEQFSKSVPQGRR